MSIFSYRIESDVQKKLKATEDQETVFFRGSVSFGDGLILKKLPQLHEFFWERKRGNVNDEKQIFLRNYD